MAWRGQERQQHRQGWHRLLLVRAMAELHADGGARLPQHVPQHVPPQHAPQHAAAAVAASPLPGSLHGLGGGGGEQRDTAQPPPQQQQQLEQQQQERLDTAPPPSMLHRSLAGRQPPDGGEDTSFRVDGGGLVAVRVEMSGGGQAEGDALRLLEAAVC